MVRICYTAGIDIKVSEKDGQIILEGPSAESQRDSIELALHFGNLSEFILKTKKDDCIDTFLSNQSDLSVGLYYLHDESGRYSVPVPTHPTSLNFLTGFNAFEYENEQKVKGMKFDVLTNFGSYCPFIYALTCFWMLVLLMIIFTRLSIHRVKSKVLQRWTRSFKILYYCIVRGSKNWRWLVFLLSIGFFLLSTPFFLLFKTNQVVIQKPFLILSHEQIMKSKAQIVFTAIHLTGSIFLEPPSGPCQDKIMCKMWQYFTSNSRKVTFNRTPESMTLTNLLVEEVISKKSVFVASHGVAESFRQILCSWSKPPNLYQVFRIRDPHQREILVGYAFREPKFSVHLVKKVRNLFEFHIPSHIVHKHINYAGFNYFYFGESHRQRQRALCHQRELTEYHKEEVFASDVHFFGNFFTLLSLLILFAYLLLVLEMKGRRKSMNSRNPKICPEIKSSSFPPMSIEAKMRRRGFMQRYISTLDLN